MSRYLVVGAVVLSAGAVCRGQSFNIDFAPVGSAGPSSSYGGAGPAGFWNVISGASSDHLRGLDGSLTNVPNFAIASMTSVNQTLSGPTGDDATLLNSFIPLIDVVQHATITGLQNGNYNIVFYGLNSGGNVSTGWQIDPNFDFTSGVWTGQLTLGRTHVVMPATVTDGTLTFGMVGSIFGSGHFAGMQIVQVPGPGVGAVGVLGACLVRRRRRPIG
jgi:hypothetical protein